MSTAHSKRVVVWVQHFADRPRLMLQWHDAAAGKRRSKCAETCNPLAAETARADLEYELNNGLHQEASLMSWERFRELFEAEYLPGLRPGTRTKYGEVLDLFEELASPKALGAVSERTVAAFLSGMRGRAVRGREGMMPSTMRVYLQLLHTALAYAARQRLVPRVPGFPTVRAPRKRPQPVAVESFERLLERAPDEEWRALLQAAWLAGLRAAEAYNLRWEPSEEAPWIDLARGRIVLPAAFAKAAEDQWAPIDPALRSALEGLPRRGPLAFQLAGPGGRRLALSSVCDRVRRLARKAGVRLSLHPLRRGFGCRYAGKVPAQVLQRLMRHKNIKTTVDYYANVDEAVEEAVLGKKEDRGATGQGAQRNGSRNKQESGGRKRGGTDDATDDSSSASG